MSSKKFSFADRFKSFAYAWAGMKAVLKTEHNTWIHLCLSIVSIALGFVLNISRGEFLALIIVIAMVWVTELFNTCFEKTMDLINVEKHPQIKLIKDMAAAAVLISAIAAVIVGALIFIPKIF